MSGCIRLPLISNVRDAKVRLLHLGAAVGNCLRFSAPAGSVGLLALFIAAAPLAEEAEEREDGAQSWLSSAQYHGFLSQGYIKTDHNRFFGDSEKGSFEFTELGINGTLNPVSNLRVSAQLNYRRAGENSPEEISLDYGFVDYRFADDSERRMGLRLGRIKNPYGFYNETRDVAATRPSVLLPQSIYSDPLRDVWHSADSIGAYYYGFPAGLEFRFDSIYGRSDAIGETVARVRLPGYDADLDSRYIGLARMSVGSDVGSWKLAYTFGKTALDFSTSAPIHLQRGEVREAINLLSGEYLLEQWIFTAEYQQLETWSRAERVPAVLGTSESWYLQSAWLFRPKWRALLRFDQYRPDRDTGDLRTRDLSLGLRYDYDNHWMAAVEYHRVEGITWLSPADNMDVAELENDWQLLAAMVSYRF
ncbi:hypothetical protein [Microbulbifer taiwanensis]|uniref:Porin n=1 Tax=Microbulbifer taiwanensis TaxID=986746 RepID=A0ABW1YTY3_9GAMM|nr:hypothetical protein [Microbulbifer taiwanensis]